MNHGGSIEIGQSLIESIGDHFEGLTLLVGLCGVVRE